MRQKYKIPTKFGALGKVRTSSDSYVPNSRSFAFVDWGRQKVTSGGKKIERSSRRVWEDNG